MLKDFLQIPRRNPQYRAGRTEDFKDVEIRPSREIVAERLSYYVSFLFI